MEAFKSGSLAFLVWLAAGMVPAVHAQPDNTDPNDVEAQFSWGENQVG